MTGKFKLKSIQKEEDDDIHFPEETWSEMRSRRTLIEVERGRDILCETESRFS